MADGEHYNRRLQFGSVKQPVRAGPLIQAPVNQLAMFTDYVDPSERSVACPNQDVVYGMGALALDMSPVVVQVPDFGESILGLSDRRLAHRQLRATRQDVRYDARASICWWAPTGKPRRPRASRASSVVRPAPAWSCRVSFRTTRRRTSGRSRGHCRDHDVSAVAIRRHDEDHRVVQAAEGAGTGRRRGGNTWVSPEKFVVELAAVLADAPPLPGEESRYAQVLAVLAAVKAMRSSSWR